ncbi:MAG: TonB-dependent receptor [Candidatus Pedobacter colombiensis]|uniref:TonB-dependent receptor n=1 Tax=Candidatus Pedobacter colombiensis TaxID=3121371 RepID=A0AAJ5W513_9SPHI|nr:TonB-dependent receptor [Pedobacter sp.]WEK17705.1 MAG: TonB-dependent receptor [Pedobacter sp.]
MNPILQTHHYLSKKTRMVSMPLLASLVLSATAYGANSSSLPIENLLSYRKQTAQVVINGTVKDAKGKPIPGVSVRIKGSGTVTSTDANGAYKLTLPIGNEILVFSYIGFNTQEVRPGNKTTINIILEEGNSGLDEVVVIGYGTVKKKDLTGAVSSVKAADIALSPVSNPIEALQGRVAGLDIERSSGKAGASPSILLRGNRSINGSSTPLYIIDGIPGNITMLNPNDIESIDVLKDASSTAIYGVAGANGVIIVTTKKAIDGKTQIDVDSYYGVNGFAKFPKPLMNDAWVQYLKDKYFALKGLQANSLIDLDIAANVRDAINAGQWIDWVDETLRTGIQQNHHVSLRGGTEKTQAYMSLGYIGEKGIYKSDASQIFNVRAGVDVRFNKLLKAGIQTTFNGKNIDATNSRINKAFGVPPVGEAYNEDGSVKLYPLGTETDKTAGYVSPIANYAPGVLVNNTKNLNLALNPYAEFTPIKNLMIRSNLGLSISSSRNGTFQNEKSYNLASESRINKEASYSTGLGYSYIWENFATYNFVLENDHSFTVTGITSMQSTKNESSTTSVDGLDYDKYLYYNLGAGKNVTGRGTSYSEISKMSYAARLNYSYKGKYLLTASNRWDGASQLFKHWSAFPSVALGWRISEENFMQDTKSWLSNLKIRASYGGTGNDGIDPYQSITEVSAKTAASNLSLGGTSILPIYVLKQALGNFELTWEKSYSTNLGLDFSLLKDRLNVSVDWYHTHTDGVLYKRALPTTSGGFDAKNSYIKVSNIAKTENQGIEFTLNSRNIVNKDFQWSSALTFTKAKEKLKSIDLGNSVSADQLISENLFVGYPLKTTYDYKKIGVWQLGEEAEALKYGAKPGDVKLATVPRNDANGVSDEGVHTYSAKDKMILGHRNPDWTLGLQNTFVYKNFDLTVFVNMRYGQTINAPILGYWNAVAQPASYNYWTPTNPTNDFPQPGSTMSSNYLSALSIVDGSYVKIKNVTLGYTLPKNVGSKLGISRMRIYGTAYNPFIYAKSSLLKDVDPETGGSDSFPLYKQLVLGINMSF